MSSTDVLRVRCVLEQMVVRDLFFEEGENFLAGVVADPAMLYGAMNEVMKGFEMENPYEPSQFQAEQLALPDVAGVRVEFPEPEEAPACYAVYMLCDKTDDRAAYFAVERDKGSDMPKLARWDKNGEYYRHGQVSLEKDQLLETVLSIFRGLE